MAPAERTWLLVGRRQGLAAPSKPTPAAPSLQKKAAVTFSASPSLSPTTTAILAALVGAAVVAVAWAALSWHWQSGTDSWQSGTDRPPLLGWGGGYDALSASFSSAWRAEDTRLQGRQTAAARRLGVVVVELPALKRVLRTPSDAMEILQQAALEAEQAQGNSKGSLRASQGQVQEQGQGQAHEQGQGQEHIQAQEHVQGKAQGLAQEQRQEQGQGLAHGIAQGQKVATSDHAAGTQGRLPTQDGRQDRDKDSPPGGAIKPEEEDGRGKGPFLEGAKGGTKAGAQEQASTVREDMEADLGRVEELYRWNKRQRDRRLQDFGKNITLKRFREVFLVPPYPCLLEGRFGRWGEGGNWVCLSHRHASKAPLVISVGAHMRRENSFEKDIATRLKGFSHTFDCTVAPERLKGMIVEDYLQFYSACLAGEGDVDAVTAKLKEEHPKLLVLTLPQMLAAVNEKWVDIFRLDCEKCEFAVVQDMLRVYKRDTVPFGQFLVEVHSVQERHLGRVMRLVQSVESLGFRLFHVEVNGACGHCFEMAFIHESLVKPNHS